MRDPLKLNGRDAPSLCSTPPFEYQHLGMLASSASKLRWECRALSPAPNIVEEEVERQQQLKRMGSEKLQASNVDGVTSVPNIVPQLFVAIEPAAQN